jgi:hypothetical protein
MPQIERQQTVLDILKNLRDMDGLKKLFWEELSYERENKPLSTRRWPDNVRNSLSVEPVLFASGGEDSAFHVIYCCLNSDSLLRGLERPVVNQLLSEHPYCLIVFSNKSLSCWHFLNVKYEQDVKQRRLLRRIAVRPGEGLRTAAERMVLLDLQAISPDLFGLSPMIIQKHHDVAFDVEKVTKDFYDEIAKWYFWARTHAVFPKDAPVDKDGKPSLSLIRLLTRLIFCWFLREKRNPQTGNGLIPDALFDKKSIKDLLKDPSPESCTYYTAILQNLFFATLNTEMDKSGQPTARRFLDEGDGQRSDDHMVHQYWRHPQQLKDPVALENLLRDIPFLNGGLFECLDERVQKGNSSNTFEIRIDGFSSDPKKQPKLPNSLFYGISQDADLSEEYGDSSRKRETVRPLLEILNRYNFTLTENTPFDQEVALDPELLGHVFENLLAAFNPETGTVARKATGSFYTPRVVVDWMVDQSLIVYLKENLGTNVKDNTEKKLKSLLSWEEYGHDFKPSEVEKLIDAIDKLKAIDPACGSGAFPMGMLQKLVHVLKKLDPENHEWRKRQERAANSMESSTAREEALKAIERAFARDNDDYGRKLYLIENCLYGVDIQPIAVQIAKLRFFVSLVVDQTIDPEKENYGILPLPNLETKVVAANTLLGLHRGQLLLWSNEVKSLETELQNIRHDYFTARRYKDKKLLRIRDRELCKKLSKALSDSGECTPYDAKRLAEWNPYDTNKSATFFDPAWMFGIPPEELDGNFDIVIGNPPYVRQEELKNQTIIDSDGKEASLKDALERQYECFTGRADLYVYFFERSLQLMRTRGVLSFITSNKYFRAGYGERLRTLLFYSTAPHVILDFGDAPVFTSIAYPAILVTQKLFHVQKGTLPQPETFNMPERIKQLIKNPDRKLNVLNWTPGPDIREFPAIFEKNSIALAQCDLKQDSWRFGEKETLRLLDRMRLAGKPLGNVVEGNIYAGIKTGLNKAFIINSAIRIDLIKKDDRSKEIIKPYVRGKHIKKWSSTYIDQYIIYTPRGINIALYPAIKKHLENYKSDLEKRALDQKWYELQQAQQAYVDGFESVKIVFPDITESVQFALDTSGAYLDMTTFCLPNSSFYLLSVLNSTCINYFFSSIGAQVRGGYLRFKRQYVEQIPVPFATPEQQLLCELLAGSLVWMNNPEAVKVAGDAPIGLMIAYFEQWLNGLVYELFFPGELHTRKLELFNETRKLNPPDIYNIPEKQKLGRLQEIFYKAYDKDATLRGMLFDLRSLDVVRMIEDTDSMSGKPDSEGKE